jgi:hypothetical protein
MSSDSDLLCGDWSGTGPSFGMINGVVSVSMSFPVIKPWAGRGRHACMPIIVH